MDHIKITPIDTRDSQSALYAEMMAKSIQDKPIPKIVRPISKAQMLYDNREKDPEAYKAYLERPLPTYEAAQVSKSSDDLPVGEWKMGDIAATKRAKDSQKNTLGQSEGSSTSPERKEKARQSFSYTPPTKLSEEDKSRIVSIAGYEALPPLPPEEPKPENKVAKFFKRFLTVRQDKLEVNKSGIAYYLYRVNGGRDEDL